MNLLNIVYERYNNDINGNGRIKASFFLNGENCNSFINRGKTVNHGKLISVYTFQDMDQAYYEKALKDNGKDIKDLQILKLEIN